MNSDQILSLVRSLLKLIGGILLAHGATKAAALINAEDTIGLACAIIGFVASHITHKDSSSGTSSGTTAINLLLCLLLPSCLLVGCSSTKLEAGGAYAPTTLQVITNPDGSPASTNVVQTVQPDIAFYEVDAAFDLAYSTVDGACKFERDNRQMLWSISPQVKHALDSIRPTALQVVQRYTAARSAYMAHPTPTGLSILQDAAAKIQQLAFAAQAAATSVNKPSTNAPTAAK